VHIPVEIPATGDELVTGKTPRQVFPKTIPPPLRQSPVRKSAGSIPEHQGTEPLRRKISKLNQFVVSKIPTLDPSEIVSKSGFPAYPQHL